MVSVPSTFCVPLLPFIVSEHTFIVSTTAGGSLALVQHERVVRYRGERDGWGRLGRICLLDVSLMQDCNEGVCASRMHLI